MSLPPPQPMSPEYWAETVWQVTWRYGMHARPASNVVKLAARYSSTITLQRMDVDVRTVAKSIMGLMSLSAECGALLAVSATGCDAAQAVEAMRQLFERSLDMDEWSGADADGVSVNKVTGAKYRIC